LQDLDDPGHRLDVSRRESQERADQALADDAGHPHAVTANRLVTRPGRRFLALEVPPEPPPAPAGGHGTPSTVG
jgi:hypothetical protein